MIKDDGILFSKLCANFEDLPKIKNEITKSGFKNVIFSDFSVDMKKHVYWAKNATKKEIIQHLKEHEVKKPSVKQCSIGFWYDLLAIK